ncbi:hypothetical protein [Streptomyces endophyticus]|uniref:Uncharacterized protein n=1 Tax=Streptomyces endophyticus TaxID=714166 RepID=A0ABU6F231_9ACTN|nr:hypothetical protein [Streptomyces endophyticus]MEB8338075.1 hypothetical protein [Streptomyces endophyticus]
MLSEFLPAALAAFQAKDVGLAHPEVRAVPAAAPTTAAAAALSKVRLRSLLRKAGRYGIGEPRVPVAQESLGTEAVADHEQRPARPARGRLAPPACLHYGASRSPAVDLARTAAA